MRRGGETVQNNEIEKNGRPDGVPTEALNRGDWGEAQMTKISDTIMSFRGGRDIEHNHASLQTNRWL